MWILSMFSLAVPTRTRSRPVLHVPVARVDDVKNGMFCRLPRCVQSVLWKKIPSVDLFGAKLTFKKQAKAFVKLNWSTYLWCLTCLLSNLYILGCVEYVMCECECKREDSVCNWVRLLTFDLKETSHLWDSILGTLIGDEVNEIHITGKTS